MKTQTVRLIDGSGNVLAVAHVVNEGGHYGGTIDLNDTAADVRALFEKFDEIVNGQQFSLLQGIQDKINSLSVKAVLDNGDEACVNDLQVFPSTGDVSFRLAEALAPRR